MTTNYLSLRTANEKRYGTDISRIGPRLLAHRYDDRTHFIYELLQNAESALARRIGWHGKRAVTFKLSKGKLLVSHFGTPFTEGDVRGICGIDEGNKDPTSLGLFELTWDGHEFLDKVRNPHIWDEVIANIKQRGFVSASIDFVKKLADVAIRKRLGVE